LEGRTEELVWYAAYGSNLAWESRFFYYIHGGLLPGTERIYPGCRLKEDPVADRPWELVRPLYFGHWSSFWKGGIALVGHQETGVRTKARIYLLRLRQLEDVVAQENGWKQGAVAIDLGGIANSSRVDVADSGAYRRVIMCGEREGVPILTCTSHLDFEAERKRKPSRAYLRVISAGLRETWGLTSDEIVAYLNGVPGVAGNYSVSVLRRICG
jgi:hypothetical protein